MQLVERLLERAMQMQSPAIVVNRFGRPYTRGISSSVDKLQNLFDSSPMYIDRFKAAIPLFGKRIRVLSARGIALAETPYMWWHRECHLARSIATDASTQVIIAGVVNRKSGMTEAEYQFGERNSS